MSLPGLAIALSLAPMSRKVTVQSKATGPQTSQEQLEDWRDRLVALPLLQGQPSDPHCAPEHHAQALLLLESIFSMLDMPATTAASTEQTNTAESRQTILGTPAFVSSVIACCGHESLASSALWVLVRLGRRQLEKSTSHPDNLALMGARCVDILASVRPEWLRGVGGHLVAHPLCYLIMLLASDNEANQMAMVQQCRAHEVVAACLVEHGAAHSSVAEMALRACRNLAACDDNASPLLQAGLCERIVEVLSRYRALLSFAHSAHREGSSGVSGGGDVCGGTNRAGNASSTSAVLDCALWAAVNLICDEGSCELFAKR